MRNHFIITMNIGIIKTMYLKIDECILSMQGGKINWYRFHVLVLCLQKIRLIY